jgi:hypothetical protein
MIQTTANPTEARIAAPAVRETTAAAAFVNRRCRTPLCFHRLFGLGSAGLVTALIAVGVWLQA